MKKTIFYFFLGFMLVFQSCKETTTPTTQNQGIESTEANTKPKVEETTTKEIEDLPDEDTADFPLEEDSLSKSTIRPKYAYCQV